MTTEQGKRTHEFVVGALSTLRVGDQCWQMSSSKDRVFLCEVVAVNSGPGTILVYNVDKKVEQLFRFDGRPAVTVRSFVDGEPCLLPLDHPDALALEDAAAVRQVKNQIVEFVGQLPDEAAIAGIRAALDFIEDGGRFVK